VRNRIAELRADRRWTQADLAARLEVSRQTVNALERGKYDPSLPLAFRLADLFRLRIEDVFDPGDKEHGDSGPPAGLAPGPARAAGSIPNPHPPGEST
jgi:putative transcriptional regulator